MPSPTITRSSSFWVRGSGWAGTSLMWKFARRSPGIWSRSSTRPPPRIMWNTSATTVARGSPVPDAIAQALATSLMPSTKPRNSMEGSTPIPLPICSSSANRSVARPRSTTSRGGLATMYGLPSSAAWAIRRRQSSRTRACSAPSAVIQPCSAMTLTTRSPASARARFSSGKLPP